MEAAVPAPGEEPAWRLAGGRRLELSRPAVMGILNLTPDSFSDGGDLLDPGFALARAEAMVAAGATILDVGGESTRPGAPPVPPDEEVRRVLPFLTRARDLPVPLSIDTRRALVARVALDAGAAAVNDVSGLRHDPALGEVVAGAGAGLVLMHMRGDPADMAERASYGDLVGEVRAELAGSVALARRAGVPDEALVVDPGLGFAKTAEHNLVLLHRLRELAGMGFPVLVGPSRKSFLGRILGVEPRQRDAGTVAACVLAYLEGARLFRVHDVEPVAQALAVARAVIRERLPEGPPRVIPGESTGGARG